jgi:hypothetical protein
MDAPEAFAAICLAAVGCDGQLGREEAQALRTQLEFRSPFRDLGEQAMGDLFDGLLEILRTDGWSALVMGAIPALQPHQRETALALAAQLVRADRIVQPEETAFLQALARQLTLPEGRADQILEVIAVLHRDALA